MVRGKEKRIVVIKDIPSNMIEEAILILKSEPGIIKNKKDVKEISMKDRKKDDFILKEAESIIDNYINESDAKQIKDNDREKQKFSLYNMKYHVNTVINIALVGSIALLVFIIIRA